MIDRGAIPVIAGPTPQLPIDPAVRTHHHHGARLGTRQDVTTSPTRSPPSKRASVSASGRVMALFTERVREWRTGSSWRPAGPRAAPEPPAPRSCRTRRAACGTARMTPGSECASPPRGARSAERPPATSHTPPEGRRSSRMRFEASWLVKRQQGGTQRHAPVQWWCAGSS